MTSLYISADLEGICGVVSPRQCYRHFGEIDSYQAAITQLAAEVSAVAETALTNGVERIVVNDAHGVMSNLALGHFSGSLANRIELLSGKPKICAMAAGLDASFDAMFLLGYHAKAGTAQGVLCHTFHDKLFDVSVNGISYGEAGINTLYASLVHRVPVVFASGDKALCQEIQAFSPRVETLETKTGLGYAAALNHPVKHVLEAYRQKTAQVLGQKNQWPSLILTLPGPYLLEVTYLNTLAADVVLTLPGWQRTEVSDSLALSSGEKLSGRRLQYQACDFQELYQALQSSYIALSYTGFLE